MTTMELRSSVLQDIASLLSNDEAMLKLQKYIRQLKSELHSDQAEARIQFKKELKNDLRKALKEVQDVKEGKAQLGTMEDLYSELEAES